MNDLTDDILSDLEELESSTEELAENKATAKQKKETLKKMPSATGIDASSLALEAAKASQEAAQQSQNAAEAAIKLFQDFKAQIIELSDSNTSWRQTARIASQEIASSRTAMTVMMVVSIIFGIISTSLTAWFLYYTTKKQEIFKGDVLDLIQTENNLFNKSITLKVDQISSLIEAFAADFQNMSQSANAAKVTEGISHATVNIHTPEPDEAAHDMTTDTHDESAHNAPTEPTSIVNNEHDVAPVMEEHEHPASHTAPVETQHSVAQNMASDKQVALTEPMNATLSTQQYTELKNLVSRILEKQQQLEAAMLAQTQLLQSNLHKTSAAQTPVMHTQLSQANTSMTDKQTKQLEGLSWLIKKQEKTLKEIQATLATPNTGVSSTNDAGLQGIEKSLNELKAQIFNLSTQQKAIEAQVTDLQAQTQKLSESPKPYSYQVR